VTLEVSERGAGCSFSVRVTPRAKRSEIVGIEGGTLVVRLNAPPVDGKANEALIEFLGLRLGLRRSQVGLLLGDKSRRKVVAVELTADELRTRLGDVTWRM
jgi:uncharacterized protein (TIGR00251 family)